VLACIIFLLFASAMFRIRYSSKSMSSLAICGLAMILVCLRLTLPVHANEEGPDRTATMTTKVTEHSWWLVRWSDNGVVCEIVVDHEDLPQLWEVYDACG
jgi:hypothetical protein